MSSLFAAECSSSVQVKYPHFNRSRSFEFQRRHLPFPSAFSGQKFVSVRINSAYLSFQLSFLVCFLGVKTWLIAVYVSTFALISPIGVGIGIGLSETVPDEASLQNSLVTILQGLATGTLLYVVFFEVIEKERQKGTSGLVQVGLAKLLRFLATFESWVSFL